MTGKLDSVFAGLSGAGQGMKNADPRELLSPEARKAIPAPVLDKITAALSSSISQTFLWALVPAVLTVLFVLWMGKDRMPRPAASGEPAKERAASRVPTH